jgi:hypothetical protein
MDASDGDFSGSDYMFIGQKDDKSGIIEMNPNAGDLVIKVGSNGERFRATNDGTVTTGVVEHGQFRDNQFWGSWSASQSRTHVLEGSNYCQYEVVYTCYRTNGGTDNNIYIRGIWTSNHTAHHWKELENVGFVEGNTFNIVVSAASPSTTATRLTITKSAGGGQGGWSMRVTAIGANSANPTHTVT